MKNNFKAFSLIEAMVILMMISLAIMLLIPLISQKTNVPRWMPIKDENDVITSITYGTAGSHRVNIGATNYPETGKLTTKSLVFAKDVTDPVGETSPINLGYFYGKDATTKADKWTKYAPTSSIVAGVNPCVNGATPNNALIIKSAASPGTCSNNSINIGDKIIYDGSLKIGTNGTEFITLNNDNSFTIKYPTGGNALNYNGTTLTITTKMLNIGETGTGALHLDAYGAVISDIFTCYDKDNFESTTKPQSFTAMETLLRTLGTGSRCVDALGNEYPYTYLNAKNKYTFGCYCGNKFKDNSNNTYCCRTESDVPLPNVEKKWWFYSSDKRLKNILSDFNKSIDDFKSIETYNFTYKNDKKQRLHVGLIAQKLKGVYDEALHQDENGYYSYEKEPIFYSMVNGVKEIFGLQKELVKKQAKLNKKAEKLIRMYE